MKRVLISLFATALLLMGCKQAKEVQYNVDPDQVSANITLRKISEFGIYWAMMTNIFH